MLPYITSQLPGAGLLVTPMRDTAPFSAVLALSQVVIIVPASATAASGGVPVLSRAQARSLMSELGEHSSTIQDWAARRGAVPLDLGTWQLERLSDVVELSGEGTRLRFDSDFGCHPSDMEVFLNVLRLALDAGP